MNKKGFTTIEIVVSISLVAIILIPLLASLVKLREDYSKIDDDSDVRIIGSSIVRIINNDIIKNEGIKTIECSEKLCEIELNNNSTRTIKLREDISEYITYQEDEEQNQKENNPKTITRTTIEYKDTTNNKKILTKTLSSISEEVEENNNQNKVRVKYYHMTHFTLKTDEYSLANNKTKTLYTLTINVSNKKYNLKIYGLSN